jgi:hypothetical protein
MLRGHLPVMWLWRLLIDAYSILFNVGQETALVFFARYFVSNRMCLRELAYSPSIEILLDAAYWNPSHWPLFKASGASLGVDPELVPPGTNTLCPVALLPMIIRCVGFAYANLLIGP